MSGRVTSEDAISRVCCKRLEKQTALNVQPTQRKAFDFPLMWHLHAQGTHSMSQCQDVNILIKHVSAHKQTSQPDEHGMHVNKESARGSMP